MLPCPRCGSPMKGSVCPNCGYSLRKEPRKENLPEPDRFVKPKERKGKRERSQTSKAY